MQDTHTKMRGGMRVLTEPQKEDGDVQQVIDLGSIDNTRQEKNTKKRCQNEG